MPSDDIISRRKLLSLLCGAACAFALPTAAIADDDDDEEDSGGDDSGGGDNSNSGSGGSGGGSDDDDDEEDEDENEDSGGSGSGSGSKKPDSSGTGKRDQDRVKDAVKKGDAIPLAKALALLKDRHDGRVIEVLYSAKGNRIDYRFKILDGKGKVISVTMDARTGRIRGFLGF